jgi:hypothetical protein
MTQLLDDTLAAIDRQLSAAYLPTVPEPLPRELEHLVLQLVAFEMHKRGSGATPTEALQVVMEQLSPDAGSADSSVKR